MSDTQQAAEEQPKKGGGKMLLIVGGVLAMGAGGAGFMIPTLAPQLFQDEATAQAATTPRPKPTEFVFLEFGEVVVNLNSDRFNRYLKTQLTLQVGKEQQESIAKLIEERRSMLKGWLLSHLADKTMEEIRGATGQNRLRREIHDQFNTILYTDGYDPIEDVYFEEFNVQ